MARDNAAVGGRATMVKMAADPAQINACRRIAADG
jgi:hypothetical protein